MAKICFIVGHGKSKSGGYDPGATSGNYHEFKIAKEIAKYAQDYYNKNFNEQCDIMNYDGTLYLSDRIKRVNANDYDLIIEFHLNAGGGTGTECYYSKGSAWGKKVAQAICSNISYVMNVKNRGAKTKTNSSGKDYFGIIRQTECEALLLETLFIDTAADLGKINHAAGQKAIGEAIAKAVASARGVSKKVVQQTTPKTTYKVQIGAFKIEKNAKAFAQKVQKAGFSTYVFYDGKYYRVQTGAFSDRANAVALQEKLKAAGFVSFILTVKS